MTYSTRERIFQVVLWIALGFGFYVAFGQACNELNDRHNPTYGLDSPRP